jgi:hypothetical protein
VHVNVFVVMALTTLQVGSLWAWTTPERVDRRPADYHTFMPALTVTADGVAHAVWSEAPPPYYYACKVMYACREGDTWTIPANISRDSGDLRTQVIATDSPGHLVVVWSEEGAARLRYVRRQNDTWSTPKPCFANRGITPRTAVDSRGRIHLIYEDLANPGGIWYSYYESELDTWAAPVRVAQGTSELGWSSLAVDRLDHLHAVWMDFGTNGVGYAFNDGSGWSSPEQLPDPAPSGQSCDPIISADSGGRPFVVWEERSGGYWVYFSQKDADTWTTPYRVYDQNGGRPWVAVDSLGNAHVVWGWETGLLYSVRTRAGWQVPFTLTDSACCPGQLMLQARTLHLIWRESPWAICYSETDVVGACEEPRAAGIFIEPSAPLGSDAYVTFTLAESAPVSVCVIDAGGRSVLMQRLGFQSAGTHRVRLGLGRVASGVYFVQLRAGGACQASKATLTR